MTAIETRTWTELRAVGDGREVTGLVAPFNRPAMIRKPDGVHFIEQFVPDSLIPVGGAPLYADHPDSSRVHDERDMPVSPPGEFADDDGGMYGRWRVAHSPVGDSLLDGIRTGRYGGLSVGFVPSTEDEWNADRSTVVRHGAYMTHVAAVGRGAYDDARVLEIRASQVSAADRRRLAAKGWALPDGSFPIPDAEHLHAAAVLAASKHGDYQAARKLIRKRAKDLGVDVTTLPGFGPEAETRMSGPAAWAAAQRRRTLIDMQERAYPAWRGVASPEQARAALYDRALREP